MENHLGRVHANVLPAAHLVELIALSVNRMQWNLEEEEYQSPSQIVLIFMSKPYIWYLVSSYF